MRIKKDLGKFLGKKKSWRKILQYLEKYLNKYKSWKYTYEFDHGNVQIMISSNDGGKLPKENDRPAEPKCEGNTANKKRLRKRKRRF